MRDIVADSCVCPSESEFVHRGPNSADDILKYDTGIQRGQRYFGMATEEFRFQPPSCTHPDTIGSLTYVRSHAHPGSCLHRNLPREVMRRHTV